MSDLVLIADGNLERGKLLAAACAANGIACRVTTHGAGALEAALADLPVVLVAQLDLPLIDAPQLAAILEANPRTQGIERVFLADRLSESRRTDTGGHLVPPAANMEEVAGIVQSLLAQREARSEDAAEVSDDGGVGGQLAQLPLADLLQLFHVGRKTGTVEVMRGAGHGSHRVGQVHLTDGDIEAAHVNNIRGEKALFRMLAWEQGTFAFKPGRTAAVKAIQTPTRALLREGLRQLAEWERLAVELPPVSAHVTLKVQRSALPNVIHPLTQEVLLVLELYSKVADVVDHCSFPDYQVLRTLHTLSRRGIIELRTEPAPTELITQTRMFPSAHVARLREWLDHARPRGGAVRDAKLIVISSGLGATRDFTRLLAQLPGVEIDERLRNDELRAECVSPIAHIEVNGDVGVEIIHIPAEERFAPLWPLAAHGSLGVLFLLSGAVGEAVAAVRRPAESLRNRPRTRIFHLLLLDKGQGISPDDVRENLALVDEGSLFLIPLENGEKAGVLLREMIGRILP